MHSPETAILAELIKRRDGYVSGGEMARKLGVSRVSVWAVFEKLRAEGFEFSAAPKRGYRLEREPNAVHAALLRAYLSERGCAARVVCLAQTESTNDEAQRRLLAGEAEGGELLFVVANAQTRGRGRMGRAWYSGEAGNVYLSLGFCPKIAAPRLAGYTLWAGLRLCAMLAERTGLPFKIKWPNDLMCGERKVGGILTEAHLDAETVYGVVLGLGFNVDGAFEGAPAEVKERAASLRTLTNRAQSVNGVAADLIACLAQSTAEFLAGETWRARLLAQWPQFDALENREIRARGLDGVVRTATALGIDETGGLRVRYAGGAVGVLRAGDVTLSGLPLPE